MEPKGRLLELDCLRGIAVLLVIAFHFTFREPGLKQFFRFGCAGVELFFMISGFVIFLTIEKTKNYKDFLISRFSRLYPAFWTAVTITTLFIISWSTLIKTKYVFPGVIDYIVNLTMIPAYFKVSYIDGVYWTLLVELLFYLFILIVFLLKKLDRIEWIGLVTLLICLVNGTVFKSSLPSLHAVISNNLPIITFFPLFIAGIIFYKIKFYKITLYRILLIVFCLIVQLALFDDVSKSEQMNLGQYAIILFVFFSLFFLYSFNYLGFIVNRVTLYLGKISYSLYLIHDYISFYILIPLFTNTKHFHFKYWIADLLIVLPIILIIATLMNKYVEIPAMNYIRKKWLARRPITVTAQLREF